MIIGSMVPACYTRFSNWLQRLLYDSDKLVWPKNDCVVDYSLGRFLVGKIWGSMFAVFLHNRPAGAQRPKPTVTYLSVWWA